MRLASRSDQASNEANSNAALRRDKPEIKPKRVGFEIGDMSALLCVKIEADSILDFNVKYY